MRPEYWRPKRRKRGKLCIDSKRLTIPRAPPGYLRTDPDKRQLLVEELRAKRGRGLGNKYFIPTHKVRKHLQLQKIEQYFADCNEDFIPNTPMIKIP